LGSAVLPGLNLMLEVPMLSLGLSSLVVLHRAFDRRSVSLAIAAGVLWGLALQTKYSAMAMFPPRFFVSLLRATEALSAADLEWIPDGCASRGDY
jgi:4-amino-4-deoxy-L-arabinose transferase-like glycosyltransferase